MLREEGGGSFLEAVHKYKQIVHSFARLHFKCVLHNGDWLGISCQMFEIISGCEESVS